MKAKKVYEAFTLKGPSKEDFSSGDLIKYTKVSDEEANKLIERTSGTGISVNTSYKRLIELFGKPNEEYTKEDYSDGKVSMYWVVKDEFGNVASIYDWKETNLYYQDLPSPEELKKQKDVVWHIGGINPKLLFPAFGDDEKENSVAYNLKLFIYFYES